MSNFLPGRSVELTREFRLIGVVPTLIFLSRLIEYIDVGTPDWIMYNCHVTLVMLSIGMIRGWELPMRVAAIWLVIGVPMWLIDAWVTQVLWIGSVISHLGGCLLAIYALRRVGATGRSWLPATGWFLLWQMVTRLTTAPELNVNIAHTPYELTRGWFDGYWQFWPVCAAVVALLAWSVETGLARVFPAKVAIAPPAIASIGEQA